MGTIIVGVSVTEIIDGEFREPAWAKLFDQPALQVAPHLLGCELTVTAGGASVTVRLTEVEAYGRQGEDPGAHSFNGPTARNAALFGPPRHAYVYLSYGIHYCLNLTADAHGAGGVLLRAAEVTDGRDTVIRRRGGQDTGRRLLSGPGRLGQGLGMSLAANGTPIHLSNTDTAAPANTGIHFLLRFPQHPVDPAEVRSGPRVGVSGTGGSEEFPWRFWVKNHPTVSPYRPGKTSSPPR